MRRDAGRDAGSDAGEAGWEPMPGLPEYCVVERALNPEALFSPQWESCGVGCERLAAPVGWRRAFDVVGAHDGTRGYFSPVQAESLESPRIVVLAATEGVPLAAWRAPLFDGSHLCQVGPVAIGPQFAAFIIETDDEERYYHARIEGIGSVTEPLALLDAAYLRGSFSQNLAVSDTTVAAEVQLAGYVAVVDDGVLGALADGAGPANATPKEPQLIGPTVYWTDWGAPVRIARGSLPGPEDIYLERTGSDLLGFRIDTEWVAWQQAPSGPPYATVELWASPFVEDPAGLTPRRIATLGGFSSFYAMGAGTYAYTLPDRVELYDLADGRRRVFRLPPSSRADDAPLYITDDEMLVPGRVIGALPTGPLFTLFRVRLASLPYES